MSSLLLRNARVWTADRARPRATALLIRDGRIESLDQEGEFDRVIDLERRTAVPGLIAETRGPQGGIQTAINFPSVAGVLVYDDDLFGRLSDPEAKRDFLLRSARPLYVNRVTGQVLAGPLGQNEENPGS